MTDKFDEVEIKVIGGLISSVLLTAAAQIKELELTDEMLDKFEAGLKEQRRAVDLSWMFDPTFAMYHGKQAQGDIEQAFKAVELIRQINRTVEWQFSRVRGEG